MIGNTTVVITRAIPPTTNQYGDSTQPEGEVPDPVTVAGCGLAPAVADENHQRGRNGAVTGIILYAPAGTEIAAADTLTVVDGPYAGDWQVDGQPGGWGSPLTAWDAGLAITLKRAAG